MSELPLHGVRSTLLPDPPASALDGLRAASADDADTAVEAVVADHPTFLPGWATLSERALERGKAVTAYAYARTGYHRGLDAIRRAGWGGQGPVPWSHEPNRGFLRSVHALMRAAQAIGETPEAVRCRDFLLQLDPEDGQGVRGVDVGG